MKFTHLHVHSHYSLLDGLAKIDQLLDACQELKMDSVALTDHGTMYGVVEFFQKAKKRGIKPIIGCEVYIAPNGMHQKRPNIDVKPYHLVLLVKDKEGYSNLVKLVTKAHLEGFYYKPRIDKKLLRKHSKGLIAMSACLAGEIPRAIVNNKKIEETIKEYQDIFGENFYLELQHHPNLEHQKEVNDKLIEMGKKLDIPLVATNDTHYLKKEDAEAHDVLLAVQTDRKITDQARLTMKDEDYSFRSQEEMIEAFKDTPEAISNTQKIAGQCSFEFQLGVLQLPHYRVPSGQKPEEYLKELCYRGLNKKYPNATKDVLDRLEFELGVINKMGFDSYFLIVQDFVNWAKSKNIVVGPGRGCFLPDTKILLKNGGQKNIQDIKPNERIITAFGNKRKVKKVLGYDINERIVVINSKMPVSELKLTADHRVLAVRHKMCSLKSGKPTICKPSCRRPCKKKLHQNYHLQWIQAKDLKKNDLLVYPIAKHRQIKNICFDLLNFNNLDSQLKGDNKHVWYENGTNKLIPKRIKRYIKSDKKLARLLGFYIAEGWGRTRRKYREATIGFGFNKDEKEYITTIKKLLKQVFGLESRIALHKTRHSRQVHAYSRIAARFLERLCGKYSENKHIPYQIFESSDDIVIALLTSLFQGGGSNIEAMRISFDSTSFNLVSQIKMLLARLGIMSSIKTRNYKNKKWHLSYKLTVSGEQLFKFNQLFKEFPASIKKQKFYRNDTFIRKNYIWFPVKAVSFRKYKGRVYDLTVEKDKSYVANEIAVHNSAAGSIVSYLLNITTIDPLKYNLLFERFLNPDRISMPDIDLDFADERRGEVIDYVSQKYGRDHVAQIITFGTMAARGSVRDAGRAMDFPYDFCDRTAKMIPFGMSINQALEESSEFKQYYDADPEVQRLVNMAMKLEGVARHASTHAAGVLITKDPLDKTTPCQFPTQNDGSVVSQYEMHAVEDLGLLKMDFLGLKTLTVIQNTLNQIDIDLTNLALNDEETYKLIQEGNTTGVFQLESGGFKRYLKELKPTQFEDIIAMVALYRPGPMEFIPEFIARKHGLRKITYLHPGLEPILKSTYGICVYQEQLMHIARELAGFTPGEADILRKAVGKKIKELLDEQKNKMIDGMIRNQIDKQVAVQIWQLVEPFAQYGFNKCLTGDTEIADANTGKIFTIDEIVKLKKKISVLSQNENLKLKKSKVTEVYNNGKKSVYQITTRLGKTIKASSNHPFLTVTGWKELKNLKPKDRIGLARKASIGNGLKKIKKHQLIVLGYLLSEGNLCHPQSFYYYSTDKEELADYKNSLEKFKNTAASFNHSKSSIYAKRKNIQKSSEAVDWIRNLGLFNKKATEKSFPEFVFKLNQNQLSLLLAKMFQGDGCINNKKEPQIFYATSSEKMAHQLQHLLLRLEIISALHQKKFKYRKTIKKGYTVNISRYENIGNFHYHLFPHLIGKRKKTLEDIVKNHPVLSGKIKPNSARGSKDIIPAEIIDIIRQEIKNKGYNFKEFAGKNNLSRRLFNKDTRKKGYLRETLQLIGEKIQSQLILNYANSDIYWDEIIKIESVGQEITYDLTVKNTHNYLANDFIVHNSHATCYALIGYQTAYLKAHHPAEFMSALITSEQNDIERIAFLVEECKTMGIEVLPPNVNESFQNFAKTDENTIRFGLKAVKNVGHNIVQTIVEERKQNGSFQSIADFIERTQCKDLNKKSLESLIKCGALDSFGERAYLLASMDQMLTFAREIQKIKQSCQTSLFGGETTAPSFKLTEAEINQKEYLSWEKELLGLYISEHPLKMYQEELRAATPCRHLTLDHSGRKVVVGGVINTVKKIITKTGQPMVFAEVEDLSGRIEAVVFPSVYQKTAEKWQAENIAIIGGKLNDRDGNLKILCDSVKILK